MFCRILTEMVPWSICNLMNLNSEIFIVNTVIIALVSFVFSKSHDKWYLLERMEGNNSSVN